MIRREAHNAADGSPTPFLAGQEGEWLRLCLGEWCGLPAETMHPQNMAWRPVHTRLSAKVMMTFFVFVSSLDVSSQLASGAHKSERSGWDRSSPVCRRSGRERVDAQNEKRVFGYNSTTCIEYHQNHESLHAGADDGGGGGGRGSGRSQSGMVALGPGWNPWSSS